MSLMKNDVYKIYNTHSSFCCVKKSDESVLTWGYGRYSGEIPFEKANALKGDVDKIYSNKFAFCAIKKSNGAIVCWGESLYGGECP